MKVTFDTNALEGAARPERHPGNSRQADFIKVHEAIVAGKIQGYFSETIATLEGIENDDRSAVMASTHLNMEMIVMTDAATGQESIHFNATVEQDRKPLHPEHSKRIRAALRIGMRALKAPRRIAGFNVGDPNFYERAGSEDALSDRLNKTIAVGKAIEARGVGYALVESIAKKFTRRDNVVNEMPMRSLGRARDKHEIGGVNRAIAEWADADSIAAHIGYDMDLFCTEDQGKGAGARSVLDSNNRAWLESTFGVKFVTLSELAGMI